MDNRALNLLDNVGEFDLKLAIVETLLTTRE